MKCNCRSYNAQIGENEEVVLPRPYWMPPGERENGVPVDACISGVIQHLWYHGIITRGCCCGHNMRFGPPSIILGESVENYDRVRALIAEKDSRWFRLQQWRLVEVAKGGEA